MKTVGSGKGSFFFWFLLGGRGDGGGDWLMDKEMPGRFTIPTKTGQTARGFSSPIDELPEHIALQLKVRHPSI